ncbi:LuxR family transcriptional regulator [Devosia sp. Root436]|uniref:PAS and helix-turn-helix domain-containing protein n=1 Tax=Devosia sp. Root436 TaxID=1736537 RepID=UPI0006F563BB|nr:PAS and helix-turn-helix domain-containing protein [Devosia sp. Root436]KQX38087.1 LuxR family transcriptional regulator [Devosia sp. Root436]
MTTELQFALADIPVPMVYATHRIIRDCNEEFATLFGYRREEVVDTSFSRLYPAIADFVRTGEMWRHHLPGGAVYYDERIMAGAGGKRFWCRVNGRSRDAGDPFAAALYCFEPMSRKVTETTLKLTGRQRQILTLVAQGKTNAAIAEEVGLSRRTVEAHRLRLARSVSVANSAELVAWFLSQPAG